MARTDTLGNFLTDVASAIREKKGTTYTIKASEFDTEISSIEGGGLPLVSTLDEAFSLVPQALNKIVDNYPKVLTTDATLYTPNTNCRYYCIQKRSNGTYRIVWFPNGYIVIDSYGSNYSICRIGLSDSSCIRPNGFLTGTKIKYSLVSLTSDVPVYLSEEMDTINDCINAIQSSSTIYTPNTSVAYGFAEDDTYVIPISNTSIFKVSSDAVITDMLPSQRISANETIEVSNE